MSNERINLTIFFFLFLRHKILKKGHKHIAPFFFKQLGAAFLANVTQTAITSADVQDYFQLQITWTTLMASGRFTWNCIKTNISIFMMIEDRTDAKVQAVSVKHHSSFPSFSQAVSIFMSAYVCVCVG